MKKIFEMLLGRMEAGEDAVLCSVISSSGSAPRGKGAKMAVFADGMSVGTVGGGAVEQKSIEHAASLFQTRRSGRLSFQLAPNGTQDIGMVCGGEVTIYFQYLQSQHLPAVRAAAGVLATGKDACWLLTVIWEDGRFEMGIYDRANGLQFTDAVTEGQLQPLLGSDRVLYEGEPACYVEPLSARGTVYIFGGGHVARALAPLLMQAGFRTAIFDSRPEVASREEFQGIPVMVGDYTRILDRISLLEDDYAVVMTPGHQSDLEVLEQVLRTPVGYVGCIGSRSKAARVRELLLEAGIAPKDIERIHSPIGLPIGGKSPMEVAISVAAQLVAHRSGYRGDFYWK